MDQNKANQNSLGLFVPKPSGGTRYAIGDIHGCFETMINLLEKLNLSDKDQVFFLGDYVNKGPENRKVLEFLIESQEKNKPFYFLMGNQEREYLTALTQSPEEVFEMAESKDATDILDDGKMPDPFIYFFKELPYYFELPDYWLVHAGFDFNKADPFQDLESMLYIRDFPYHNEKAKSKLIVHGHDPKELKTIESAVKKHGPIIPLDNGCVYFGERPGCGGLMALNLDSMELILQENVDCSKNSFFI